MPGKKINQQYLFPTDTDDLYKYLINLPRRAVYGNEQKIDFFVKELNIPEYDNKFNRQKNHTIAYYSSFWIFDDIKAKRELQVTKKCSYYKCKFDFYHLPIIENNNDMPDLINLIKIEKEFILEFDSLYRHVASSDAEYQKAIRFLLIDNELCVSEITVKYVGKQLCGVSQLLPRYYEILGNEVKTIRKEDDCPCNNDELHSHNLMIGKYFAEMIRDNSLGAIREVDNVYCVENRK